jgi:hypothetical protein
MKAHLTSSAVLIACLLFSGAASAQVSDADRATARTLAQQGQDALERKDYTTAADRFARAESIVHVPTLALGLARAQVGLFKWVSAVELYNKILHEGMPAGAPAAIVKAHKDARAELDALEPRLPAVIIQLKGAPAATITVDGTQVPSAALGVNRPVDPGPHVIRAEAPGFATLEINVSLAERKIETVVLELKPSKEGPKVEGPPVVKPPATPIKPPVTPTPPVTPPATASKGSLRRTIGFASLGVGAAGLVVGAATGGLALSKHGSLAKTCPDGHCRGRVPQADIDGYHTVATVSTAGFIAGGVLAATGVVLVITAPKPKPASEVSIVPVLGLGRAALEGTF